MKYAIIKNGKVANVIEADEADEASVAVIADRLGAIAVQSETAGKGMSYVNGEFIAVIAPTAEEIQHTAAIAKNKFTKLQIRRAMRSLGIEAILDGLLTNEAFAKDWTDAIEIDLSDPMTAQALSYVNVDINAVKIAISNL